MSADKLRAENQLFF
jgi:hypothetical protein